MNKKILAGLALVVFIAGLIFLWQSGQARKFWDGLANKSVPQSISQKDSEKPGASLVFPINKNVKSDQDKIISHFPNENLGKLKYVSQDNLGPHKSQWKYTYVSQDSIEIITYNPTDDKVEVIAKNPLPSLEKISKDEAEKLFFHSNHPEIPDSFLGESLEKSIELLEKSNEYKNYLEKFPSLFQSFNITAVYDRKGNWNWRFGFVSIEGDNNKRLEITVDPTEEKVFVSGKNEFVN